MNFQVVAKDEFFKALIAEKRDVVSHYTFIARGRYLGAFEYRYSGAAFGRIEIEDRAETHKLAMPSEERP